ncbi:NADH-dependent flavin oxidoreductase [Spiroplasma turonicum]|uniref:NADH-dependent flavin oxidoreductase n=1 Tax=Spiroplasma turonicum TaxID=216946 RepID=A0A0K1P561_9MOLU|nr:NADH-dependent flavin oxidoreductase [Spiroplasma turonicum]AKU79451.1 NADH-dependent flavin oxidoreductase [Spiroplasma turonicum]ALX70473.1 hypothetical protein STURO_v1c02040 [Spiroplasma turonicum]
MKFKDINIKLNSNNILKNRFVMAPMTNMMSFCDGEVTDNEINYYSLRSKEVGMVITAAAYINKEAKTWEGQLSISEDSMINSLSLLSESIKINGSKAILQIFHGGRMSNSKVLKGLRPVSASEVSAIRTNSELPRSLSLKEIYSVIDDFKKATIRAMQSGFDGVEIHGANTYLIQQFFSPHSNRRSDDFGGTIEKRYKFIDLLVNELIELKNIYNKDFIIGYRLSPEEYEEPGIRFEDTLFLVDKLSEKDLDYIHISLSNYNQVSKSFNYLKRPMISYIYELINNRTKLIVVGGIKTINDLENSLMYSDLVAIGKPLITDPNFVSKILDNKEKDINFHLNKVDKNKNFISNHFYNFLTTQFKMS